MIPYIEWTSIHIGPITLYVWGLFVALGMAVGAWASAWMARRRGLNPKTVYDLAPIVIVSALIGARIVHILFYDIGTYIADPSEIVRIWHGGMSVYGGFIGAIIATLLFLRHKQVDVWAYADATIFGLPIGLFIGRIGCFLIHDHPGTATDFILGVEYPDGVVRHDHGLYLSINGLVLGGLFFWLAKRNADTGVFIIVFSLWYGVIRFILDFTRVVDVRYAGLTPAQYLSLGFVGVGLILAVKYLRAGKGEMVNHK